MMTDVLLQEQRGHILILTLNRPAVMNAFNCDLTCALGDALEAAEHDPAVRVIVLTGAGPRAFTAGADLKAFAAGEAMRPADPRKAAWGFAGLVAHPITKPIIAAVNGVAVGGGTEIVLACDIAVAADTAIFGLPEVKRGIYAGGGGLFRIAQQVPHKIAMELLLTGDPISAARALELGLVNRVVEPDRLMASALDLAERIANNAPLAVRYSKEVARGIFAGRVPAEEPLWARNATEGARLMQSDDAREGPRAFAEKRPPVWTGS